MDPYEVASLLGVAVCGPPFFRASLYQVRMQSNRLYESGRSMKAIVRSASCLRVAPTIARLLGVSLPEAKEQPLDAALQ